MCVSPIVCPQGPIVHQELAMARVLIYDGKRGPGLVPWHYAHQDRMPLVVGFDLLRDLESQAPSVSILGVEQARPSVLQTPRRCNPMAEVRIRGRCARSRRGTVRCFKSRRRTRVKACGAAAFVPVWSTILIIHLGSVHTTRRRCLPRQRELENRTSR